MGVTALRVSNLPLNIKEEELLAGLLESFPSEFGPWKTDLEIKIYQPGVNKRGCKIQIATVWLRKGEVDLNSIRRIADDPSVRIKGREWRFLEDFYEERHPNGDLKVKISAVEKRERNTRRGICFRRPMQVFNPAFLDKVGSLVWNGWNTIYAKQCDKSFNQVNIVGKGVGRIAGMNSRNEVLVVACESALEALQILTYFNQNGAMFCDSNGENNCLIQFKSGLGKDGAILKLCEIMDLTGYIPFDSLRSGIVNFDWMNKLKGKCWRCGMPWKVLGVELNLNYFAATCKCTYDRNLDPMAADKGYCWKNETFTRLQLQDLKKNDSENPNSENQFEWRIFHQPFQARYSGVPDYRSISGPILQEDWKYSSTQFKSDSSTTGRIVKCRFIEKTIVKASQKKIFSMDISVTASSFWSPDCVFAIGGLTLTMSTTQAKKTEKRKADLCDVIQTDADKLLLRCRVYMSHAESPVLNSEVDVVAKPVKTEYENTLHALNRWVSCQTSYLYLSTILSPSNQISFIPKFQICQKIGGMHVSSFTRLRSKLNKNQQEAFDKALKSPISVCQGPPGCGKTFSAAILVSALVLKEKGTVICCAPSNFAADNFASSISDNYIRHGMPIKVVRIYSQKKEHFYAKTGEVIELGTCVKVLHQEIIKDPMWLKTREIQKTNIKKKWDDKRFDLLSKNEREILKGHKMFIERKILDSCDVIVATCGSLSDNRVAEWDSKKEKISTVVVDEAGMLPQTAAINAFQFGQHRMVFFGDPAQLRHQCESHAAKIAGLSTSIIEWFAFPGSTIPWTVLDIQHRMRPANRQIVSDLTYKGILKDSERVLARPPYAGRFLQLIKPKLLSPVLVLDHNVSHTKSGTSFYNDKEAKSCLQLCNIFVNSGMPAKEITILSLYEAQHKELTSVITNKEIAIRNVDAFQGRESNVVILSMVRGGGNTVGFAADLNRLNVAISRSRELLIILCNIETFRRHKTSPVINFIGLLEKNADIRQMDQFFKNI